MSAVVKYDQERPPFVAGYNIRHGLVAVNIVMRFDVVNDICGMKSDEALQIYSSTRR